MCYFDRLSCFVCVCVYDHVSACECVGVVWRLCVCATCATCVACVRGALVRLYFTELELPPVRVCVRILVSEVKLASAGILSYKKLQNTRHTQSQRFTPHFNR